MEHLIAFQSQAGFWGMLAFFAAAAVTAFKFLLPALKNKRIQKSIGYGLGLDEAMSQGAPELAKAILAFVEAMQKDRIEDRRESVRQWERIEASAIATQELSSEIRDLTAIIRHSIEHFNLRHTQHDQAFARIEAGQTQLAGLIYQSGGLNGQQRHQQQPRAR